MKIFIRSDANQNIATGHIMRCLSIAHAFRKMGEECIFITSDEDSIPMIEADGYRWFCLYSNWDKLENEIDKLYNLIVKENIELLIIDSYYVTPKYMSIIYQYTKVVYIDDLNAFYYNCDFLVNYSIFVDKFHYTDNYKQAQLILGCKYVPLRQQFTGLSKKSIKKHIKRILVLSGGTDNYNFIKNFVIYVIEEKLFQDIYIDIIIGRFNKNRDILEKLSKELPYIKILYNVSDVEKHMQNADIAISAGGSTLYELCACGTPAVSYSVADNQIDNVEGFNKEGIIPYAGDVRKDILQVIKNLCEIIESLNTDSNRESISKKMQHIVDGYGSSRLVKILMDASTGASL